MSYTPTTWEVRAAYPQSKALPAFYDEARVPAVEAAGAEFDRWLEAHDAEVRAAERERIAGLLVDLGEDEDYMPVRATWRAAARIAREVPS